MGKLADLASIKTANSDSFVYTPPDAAFNAPRILVKVSMAYEAPHPATVSLPVLAAVLRGLRRASPVGRILIVDGSIGEGDIHERFEQHGLTDILDREMRLSDSEELVLTRYLNTSPQPAKYDDLLAPAYIQEFDCAISVAPLKRPLVDGQPLIPGQPRTCTSYSRAIIITAVSRIPAPSSTIQMPIRCCPMSIFQSVGTSPGRSST